MDGLKIKDFPELRIRTDENGKQKEVTLEKVPVFVVVRSNLSKLRLEYRTQLAEEGAEILKEWLDKRIRSGEVLGPESVDWIITSAVFEQRNLCGKTLWDSWRVHFVKD